jgi:hypothetical protein
MPWELCVIKVAGKPPTKRPEEHLPLGPIEEVQRLLESVLPGIEIHREPPGANMVEMMKECGFELPESTAALLGQGAGRYGAFFEADGITFEFSFGHENQVRSAILDVRGNGDPMPVIERLTASTGWCVYDMTSN